MHIATVEGGCNNFQTKRNMEEAKQYGRWGVGVMVVRESTVWQLMIFGVNLNTAFLLHTLTST